MISTREENNILVSESDCCGNGCANCILDIKPKQTERLTKSGKKNVLLNYSKFMLLSKTRHSTRLEDVLELHFSYADKSKTAVYILDILPGHHVMMRVALPDVLVKEGREFLLRPFSPYWVDVTKLEFKILVNLKPQGPMSRYISNLAVNEEVEFRGPIGTYIHHTNEVPNCVYIFTQGVAVAPALPIIEEILSNEDDMSRVFHMACFSDLKHVYFRDRLQDFNKYWNYKGIIFLAHQQCGSGGCESAGGCTDKCENFLKSLRYKEAVFSRKLNATDVKQNCGVNGQNRVFIVSGTRQFQNYVIDMVKSLELVVGEENIFQL